MESSELKIYEDSTIYREDECADLLKRLDEGNKKTGGLKLVTACYGIVGMLYVQDYTTMQSYKNIYIYIYIYILSMFWPCVFFQGLSNFWSLITCCL